MERIECTYYGELGLGVVNNQIFHAVLYKEYPAISEQKAYEKIANGEFYFPGEETLNIEVNSCTLTYIVDSKAFYQLTYQFETVINGKENQILIPAYDF